MAGQLTIDTLKASSGVLATQNGMTGIAKAWVNYNGQTQVIRGSYNVSSVTFNGTGDYTVNFSTALANANFVCLVTAANQGTSPHGFIQGTYTTTSVRLSFLRSGVGGYNENFANVGILGN